MKATVFTWIRRRLLRHNKPGIPSEIVLAQKLIHSIDQGGIPLYPAKVNAIARSLGLEVSTRAPVEQTVERIRAWLKRI